MQLWFYPGLWLRSRLWLEDRGLIWPVRIIRLLHTIPYLAVGYGMGYVIGLISGLGPSIPNIYGWLEVGMIFMLMCGSWFKEWRRVY